MLRKMNIATGIVVDKPTKLGNIYPRDVIERVVKDFNIRAMNYPNKGSELNPRRIEKVDDPSHITKKMFINSSNMLCAEIEILDSEAGHALLNKIIGGKQVVARPIMNIPSYIADGKDSNCKHAPMVVNEINSIMRVQIECDGES